MRYTHTIKRLYFIILFSFISNVCYADIEIRFGLYTSDRPSDLVKKFHPIINTLQQRLTQQLAQKVSIKFVMAPTYTQGINQLANGDVDFMHMGPTSYILAHNQNPAIEILVAERNKAPIRLKRLFA